MKGRNRTERRSEDGLDLGVARRWRVLDAEDLADEAIPEATPSPAALRLARHVSGVVRAASLHASAEPVATGLACNRRPNHKRCRGHLVVALQPQSGAVEWRCSDCPDAGVVDGWRGGRNDLTELGRGRARAGGEPIEVTLPTDVYAALLDERTLAIESDRLLYSARTRGDQIVLGDDANEVEDLYESVCAAANHAPRGAFKRRLDRACDLLDDALSPVTHEPGEKPDDLEEARAIVERATRGLVLAPAELAGLQGLYLELGRFVPGTILGPDAIEKALRETGEEIVLGREIREVLAVTSVDYRHVSIFLGAVQVTLRHVAAFGERSPGRAIGLYRRFLAGIAGVADRIAVDENDLADVILDAAQVALALGRRVGAVAGLRPVVSDLLEHWQADTCCAFHFVPDLLVGLGLGKRERGWLRRQLDERAKGMGGQRRGDLVALGKRLA